MKKDFFVIRKTGGTRGNSNVGQNFGRVGDPQPTTVNINGREYATTVEHRSGSLLLYAVEYFTASLTMDEVITLLKDGSRWNIIPLEKTDGKSTYLDTRRWIIPGKFPFYENTSFQHYPNDCASAISEYFSL